MVKQIREVWKSSAWALTFSVVDFDTAAAINSTSYK